ncbi:sodium bicarbonate cotransporter 3 [Eurytemora carolleeae]|uniref:sodium bicarbonate cotransporter 3 n=1 Tax=Eurytemora carolleeae TaxID=1294199 RepID=UPI000C7759DA|nr:sodium bicarbonate cotransporter 3 [Eurytemora carolleeae]|eukprot:XP_023330571.1 sodium bicarbonate cotransporter 3-like [Eurytemora affinis]
MDTSSDGSKVHDPVLPMYVQMNGRILEEDDQWKALSRWVKFQEDLEDGGQRWSKPYVPSCTFSVMLELKELFESSTVLLGSNKQTLQTILDEFLQSTDCLTNSQAQQIQQLFSQGVKQNMRLNIVRQISKTSSDLKTKSKLKKGMVGQGEDEIEGVEEEEKNEEDDFRRDRHRADTLKYREYNQFGRKVPKNAEVANIQVGTCDFLDEIVFGFIRLDAPVVLEDLSALQKPTRFLVQILGPEGSAAQCLELGRAVGTIFTDEIFTGQYAYKSLSTKQLVKGLELYMKELTVLPPNCWDPKIRLLPPTSPTTVKNRLISRALIRQRSTLQEDDDIEDDFTHKVEGEKGKQNDGDGLKFTGRLFGGLIEDVKRKIPWYKSDFTDAFHVQTLASIIYIYLATITKAITFGGFLSDITEGRQGVLESFLGHALAGGVFCLLGGQPLTVLGCTGPVLIFEKILVEFCSSYELEYLTIRLWIGLWSALFCLVIVATDSSAIVRYFTRFTEESFAALVGVIFIVESLKKVYKMGKKYKVHRGYDPNELFDESCKCISSQPQNVSNVRNITEIDWNNLTVSQCKKYGGELVGSSCAYVPDVFLFSVILFAGTYILCSSMKKFKFSTLFPTMVRSLISDYAVILTILIFVGVDSWFDLATPKLIVPTLFKPTRSDIRGWIIPFMDPNSPWYIYLGASVPALLLTILLFMDQQITSVIVNRKEHKLKKGAGYHLDMLIVGVMMAVCSVLGLPWCVAATVLCLGHVDSLKMDTESSAPGETPQFLGIREQRVTGCMVFILTGLSVKLAPILKFIPMPVLYGVLLYMGVNTLHGMQFVDRLFLLVMPAKHQPDYLYLRHVPLKKVHLFTLIQVFALAALWVIKSTPASLIFPLLVLALVGFRKAMDFFPRIFSQKELFWLDNLMPQSEGNKKKKKNMKKKKHKEEENSDFKTNCRKEELMGLTGKTSDV